MHDIQPLADYLSAAGFSVVCVKLPGHTGVNRDLARATYRDWIESADQDLLDLLHKCDRVSLVGFSMGGLIAVNLALSHRVDSIVFLNTPIYYWNAGMVAVNVVRKITSGRFADVGRYVRGAANPPPTSALLSFLVLLRRTRHLFTQITCPVFVGQAVKDEVVQPRSAEFVMGAVSSEHKELRFYEQSGHVLLQGSDRGAVCADVAKFLSSWPPKST